MALVNQPEFLPSVFASNGDANTIPASNDGTAGLASWLLGFPAITQTPLAQGGLPPQRADFNGIFKAITAFLMFYQAGGVFTYSTTIDYNEGAFVIYNNLLYFCTKENGPNTTNGQQAPTQTGYWSPLVQSGIDNTFTGTNTFGNVNASSGANINLTSATTVTVPTPTQANSAVTLSYLQANASVVGDVAFRPYLASGWVKANGATVQRSDYPNLVTFANNNSLWTSNPTSNPWMFGNGDGSTTMVLPDYRNRFIEGGDSVGTMAAGLPNITGYIQNTTGNQPGAFATVNGAFTGEMSGQWIATSSSASTTGYGKVNFNASNSNSIYGNSSTVQPPSIVLIPQIKY